MNYSDYEAAYAKVILERKMKNEKAFFDRYKKLANAYVRHRKTARGELSIQFITQDHVIMYTAPSPSFKSVWIRIDDDQETQDAIVAKLIEYFKDPKTDITLLTKW